MAAEVVNLVVGVLSAVALVLGGTHRMLVRFEARTSARFDQVDARMDRMDTRSDRMDVRLDRMDARLDDFAGQQRAMARDIAELQLSAARTEAAVESLTGDVADLKIAVARLEGPPRRLLSGQ